MAVATTLPLQIHPYSVLFPHPQIRREDLHNAFPRVLERISALEAPSTNDSELDFHDLETLSSDGKDDFSPSPETDSSFTSALESLFKAKYPDNAAGDNYRGLPVLHAEAALMSAARSTRVGPSEGLSASKAVQTAFMVSEATLFLGK